jgi:ABC-type bacteriocin/lantibiotic exporter with double-glycine peptidase domain
MLFLILFSLIIGIADIGSLAALLYIISFYTGGITPGLLSYLPSGLKNPDSVFLILYFLLFFIVKNFVAYLNNRAQYRFVYQVASRISEANLSGFLDGRFTDYVEVDSSVHIRKVSQQPIEFCHYVLAGIQQIATEGILILLAIVAILLFNAHLFLLLLLILLPAVAVMAYLTRKRLRVVRANVKISSEKTLQYLQEALSGFVESNIYHKNSFFTQRYVEQQQSLNQYLAEVQITQGIPSRLIEVFAVFGLFILIVVNKMTGNSAASGFITIGAFMAAAYKIIPGIVKILNIWGQVRTYEYTIDDLIEEKPRTLTYGEVLVSEHIESIMFSDLSFTYHQKLVIDQLNFHLQAGDFLGISGYSGKGKTTVINLLLGFLSPAKGDILINGVATDIRARRAYWKNIAYVKQQPFLMRGSILQNIILDETEPNESRLEQAMAYAGLQDVFGTQEEGLQKMITENGKNISGGQRQRIALARALYKNADCIILDEPFNELDESSEQAILDHLMRLRETGKMVILITHRAKSLSFCNKIVSLHET